MQAASLGRGGEGRALQAADRGLGGLPAPLWRAHPVPALLPLSSSSSSFLAEGVLGSETQPCCLGALGQGWRGGWEGAATARCGPAERDM